MPTTAPPAAAWSATPAITGEKRAMAPGRRYSPWANPPGRIMTSTRTGNFMGSLSHAGPRGQGTAREPLVGADVPVAAGVHHLLRQVGRGRGLVPPRLLQQSRSGCLSYEGGVVPGRQASASQN